MLRACATRIDAAAAVPLQLSPGDAIRIDVQDNGVGMDAHTLAHLFEPFFTTKRGGRGTCVLTAALGSAAPSGRTTRLESRVLSPPS